MNTDYRTARRSVTVNGTTLAYASSAEARWQFLRWILDALRFATEDRPYEIRWGVRVVRVLGHADRSTLAIENRKVWDRDRIRAARVAVEAGF